MRRNVGLALHPIRSGSESRVAFSTYGALFLAAAAYLYVHGHRFEVRLAFTEAAIALALGRATWSLTRDISEGTPRAIRAPAAQLAICVGIVVLTGIGAALGQSRLVHGAPGGIHSAAGADLGAAFYPIVRYGGAQFVAFVLLPTLALLPFGIRLCELGLAPRWRTSLRVGALWIVPAAAFIARNLATGAYDFGELGRVLVRNVFSNGASEEFLFRGVLLSRLRAFATESWAIFAQAAIFGLWHYGANMRASHGDFELALCAMIVHQMLFGYAMGFVAVRTRSLLVPAVFHTMYDAFRI